VYYLEIAEVFVSLIIFMFGEPWIREKRFAEGPLVRSSADTKLTKHNPLGFWTL